MRLKRRYSLISFCVVRILQNETLTGWITTTTHRCGGADETAMSCADVETFHLVQRPL
jgi:hypothetical protein